MIIFSLFPSDYFITWEYREYLHFIHSAGIFLILSMIGVERKKAFGLALIIGVATECVQLFMPYRTFEVKDILMELVGLVLIYWIRW